MLLWKRFSLIHGAKEGIFKSCPDRQLLIELDQKRRFEHLQTLLTATANIAAVHSY